MDILKSYTSNTKNKIHYTIDVTGTDNVPTGVTFYKVAFDKEDNPKSQKILDLTIKGKNKKTLDLVDEMIKSISAIKEHKPDK